MSNYEYSSGGEVFHVNARGEVSRPAIGMGASGEWRITGAVRFNNFGHIVERVGFPQCFTNPTVTRNWRYKNGKARWHLTDYDHGSNRVQMSPSVARSHLITRAELENFGKLLEQVKP